MPLKLFPSLDGLRQHATHRFAFLWRVERVDGVNLLFTDHDCPITFNYTHALAEALSPGNVSNPAGTDEVYSPIDSFTGTARQLQTGLKDANVEMTGVVLSSGTITEQDLFAGRYRGARVVEMMVDWRYPYAGYVSHAQYFIAQTTYTREFWKAQLAGVTAWTNKQVGNYYSVGCRFMLFDPNTCAVDPSGHSASGTVTAVTDRQNFSATGIVTTPAIYTNGYLTWLTGFNRGITYDVKSSSGAAIALQIGTPFDIGVGDTFTIFEGCDHTRGTCNSKFANLNNFGGFPFIPGNDVLLRGPI